MIDDPRESLAEQRTAARLDPRLVWAQVAMAYDLMALERPAEAFEAMSTALGLPHERVLALPFAHAAVASGRQEEAGRRLIEMSRRDPQDASLVEARWLIALARKAWPEASRLGLELASLADSEAEAMTRKATAAALQGSGAKPVMPRGAAGTDPATRLAAAEVRFCRMAEQGRHREAVAALDALGTRERSKVPTILQLHAAAELLLAGEEELAKKRLEIVEASLSGAAADPEVGFLRSAVGVLRGVAPASTVIEAARRSAYLDLDDAYYWAGVRAGRDGHLDVARRYWQRSAGLCCDFGFPYLVAKRLSGRSGA